MGVQAFHCSSGDTTLAEGADGTHYCSSGGLHWHCRWHPLIPPQPERRKSHLITMKDRASQGYYVLRCLVTTWEGFSTGILLDHIGVGPRFEFFVFLWVFFLYLAVVRESVWKFSLLLGCHFLVSCREQALGAGRLFFCFVLFVCLCTPLRIVELLTFPASCLRYINEGKENRGAKFPACSRIPNHSASSVLFRLF